VTDDPRKPPGRSFPRLAPLLPRPRKYRGPLSSGDVRQDLFTHGVKFAAAEFTHGVTDGKRPQRVAR